ncbi:MAG: DUF4886 domain-containing protein [Oscillospiraceae bacterium]|nr:DUF4886 domain-containing protein [Oscillospiraceae bacterium]
MLVSTAVFAVHGTEQQGYCPKCDKVFSEAVWREWTATSGQVNDEGHFYLNDTFAGQTGNVIIPYGRDVCIDLRGNTWVTKNIQMFTVEGNLSIYDSVGGGLILTTGANNTAGGFAAVAGSGMLNIHGGTIQFVQQDDIKIKAGGLIYVNGGSLGVHGGTVTGGAVSGDSDTNVAGGNIYLAAGGKLEMTGGTVSRGMALAGKSTQGGNIYLTGESTVDVAGGAVEDGYAGSDGGNIFVSTATLNVSGGSIKNGSTPGRGGNIAAVTGNEATVNISGGTITGGVAGGSLKGYKDGADDDTFNPTCARGEWGGGNIYGRLSAGYLTISGGTIDGDIVLDYAKYLTLSGTPKINLGKSNGLQINNTSAIKADISGLKDGAMIYVQADGVFTKPLADETAANAALNYFRGAVRTGVSATTAFALKGTIGTQGYCPHCKELVEWTAGVSSTADGQHCYLNSCYYTNEGHLQYKYNTVLDLNGYTLHIDGWRVLLNTSGKNLAVLDSWGGGKMEGTGKSATLNERGGLLYVGTGCSFDLYSGTLRMVTSVADSTATSQVKMGGTICTEGTARVTIHGGRIYNGKVTATEGKGGNIYSSGTLNVSGGIIQSGNATGLNGGNIYSAGTLNISGGVIMNGAASGGANIYSTKTLNVTGGIIYGGAATGDGGNINAVSATISGGLIAKGSAANGGNMRFSKGTVTVSENAMILSGKATTHGGNLYCIEKMTLNVTGGVIGFGNAASTGGNLRQNSGDATANISGGLIIAGTATNGGNLYINNGKINMTGGVVSLGTAGKGGNFYLNNNVYAQFKDDGNADTALPVVSFGKATGGNGGNILYMGTGNTASASKYYIHLGNCRIRDGAASGDGDNLYINQYALFEVLPEFAQDTTVFVHSSLITDGIYLDKNYVTCNGVYTGTLRLENEPNLPKIMTTEADPALVIGQAALVMKDGTVLWFGSNELAMQEYTDEVAYIQPDSGTLALPAGTFVIDLAGADITVTGTTAAQVYCYDSANTSFSANGTVTMDGPTLCNTVNYKDGDMTYITLAEEKADTYSFHCLRMQVTKATLRSETAGIYFSCTWNCDERLEAQIANFGVAVSLNDMPGADLVTDKDTLYTRESAENFVSGEEKNSVLINSVFKNSAADNATRGSTGIYAVPYITLKNAVAEEAQVSDSGVCYSLKDVLSIMDEKVYYANKITLENFHKTWKEAMENWTFRNIGVKPSDDSTLRILMIGNSFCYYYVEELYELLMENPPKGITEVEVYNLYSSGRNLTTHLDLWKNNKAGDYNLFKTDKNGRTDMLPIQSWTLEDALSVANWDYISLQGTIKGGSYLNPDKLQSTIQGIAETAEPLLDRCYEMFPDTQLLWHRTWFSEIGRVGSDGYEYKEEDGPKYDAAMQAVCDYMCNELDKDKPYDLKMVNSGAAWTKARELNKTLDVLPYGGLCARLGFAKFGNLSKNSGDGYHDGDIGGAQLLNAYVWYMTITGDTDVSDSTYKPVYKYEGKTYELTDTHVNMLKDAAMSVFASETEG